MSLHLPNPERLPNGHAPHNTIDIRDFTYMYGGFGLSGGRGDPPTITQGESLDFVNLDNPRHIYHTVTSCTAPCMLNGGISYPLANGPAGFDSASLGTGLPGFTAASGHISWRTPRGLAPGTYTYFCRIHPWMRGVFRVIAH
jgi:plastocyanin